jgi:hypothetical protein
MQAIKLGKLVKTLSLTVLALAAANGSVIAEPTATVGIPSIVTANGVTLRHVISSGLTSASGGATSLAGTLGQPVIGAVSESNTTLFQGFWFGGNLGCCIGRVGDANNDGNDEPNIGDISVIIDHIFISQAPLVCYAEADANGTGGRYASSADISIGDISALIDYLFVTGPRDATLLDCR